MSDWLAEQIGGEGIALWGAVPVFACAAMMLVWSFV